MSQSRKQKNSLKREKNYNEEKLREHEENVRRTLNYIHSNCESIERQYLSIRYGNSTVMKVFHHYTELWLKWLEFDIQKFEEERFTGKVTLKFSSFSYASKARSLEEFWKGLNLFKNCSLMKWMIRFTEKARRRVLLWNHSLRDALMNQLISFSIGYIVPGKNCQIQEEGPCANMVYLTTTIKGTDNFILFAILIEKTPVLRQEKVVQFEFHHYLKVIDIIKKNKDIKHAVQQHKKTIQGDPDRWIEPTRDHTGNFLFPTFANSVYRESLNSFYCGPKTISKIYLNLKESNSYKFNQETQRWESDLDNIEEVISEIDPFHQSIINKLANKQSGQEFIRFIRKIPSFRVKLTEEQENLVKSPGNVLAIGRSGTGKTTCSILRLLSTEVLFRYTLRDKGKRFSPEDLDRSTSLHTVFVTASPVLTNEVKQFYGKIGDFIKEKLRERDEKIRKKAEKMQKDSLDEQSFEDVAEDFEDEENIDGQLPQEKIEFEGDECQESSEDDEIQGPNSLEFMRDEDFPLFATVRKVIFMVDAAMKRPFFMRNKDGNVIGNSSKFQWHNEMKGALLINKEYKISRQTEEVGKVDLESSDSDSDLEIEEKSLKPTQTTPKPLKPYQKQSLRRPSYEVDFSVFSSKFFPRIKGRCNFSAVLLWTEISAYIKGSSSSFKYPGYYLPLITYTSMGRKASMLSSEDKVKIWHFFIEYERWKNLEDAYDMQDVVNYLLNQITFFGYSGVPIHYMMVDEVQDLTPATLYLLVLVTDKQLFFSGDTAQTIAKGVGFRFCDLKGLFSESKLVVPNVCQLTVNFRTHNQILGLANSLVALLETLFPLTIDKMAKEISRYDGPMPSILMSEDVQDLILVVFGRLEQNSRDAPSEFGCNQVIIVRNQESKEKLPALLKHALCLTVYEAKGLEFDDVILYNFFAESEVPANLWNKIRTCQKSQFAEKPRPRNFEDLDDSVPKLETSLEPNNPEYSLLCSELKHLYVAVTRSKKRLIIFDENQASRKGMEYFWGHMEAIHFATVQKSESGEVYSDAFGSAFAQKTSEAEWKAQGLRMFSNKYYEQAQKCFEIAGEKILAYRAEAYTFANKASQILVAIDSSVTEFQAQGKKITRQLKKEMKMKKSLAFSIYAQAGSLFLIVANDPSTTDQKKVLREAARCFSSGQVFSKAADIFKTIHLYGQAAETELARGNFEEAGDLFLKKDEYTRAIDAFKQGMNWDKLVKTIYLYKDKMTFEERQKYIQKFVPAAFEELTPKMVPSAEQETNYRKQILLEQKVIPEDSEESDDEKSENLENSENSENLENLENLENPENSEKNPQEKEELITKITTIPEKNLKSDSISSLQDSSSFVLISSENSFSLLSEMIEDVDPDDEWLQLETGSVVESLDSVINPDGSIVSDFSLLDPNQKARPNMKLIKTRLDIFAEDTTMRKIIEYISMFSEEVSSYLKSFRSSSSLVSSQVFKQDWELVSLVDLDEISSEMLGLLLDVLEEFGMFRLSLIVCNRYNLYERAGRFILSLAFKYSNLSVLTYASYKLNMKEQVQRAAIAFTALHNVFEMINPEYLSTENSNQLGFEVFQGLVLLGYWKKVAYLLPKNDFFALTWIFSDFNAYAKILSPQDEDPLLFQWLPKEESLLDLQHLIIGLDLLLNKPVKNPPKVYSCTWNILQKIEKNQEILQDLKSLGKTIQDFFKSTSRVKIETLDAITAWSFFMGQLKNQVYFDELCESSSEDFESFLVTCNFLIKHLTDLSKLLDESILIRQCILSPAGIRTIPFSKITSHLPVLTHNVVHVSSPLISNFNKNSLFALDLEGQSYLASSQETSKVFKDWIKNSVSNIINTRRRKASSLTASINSLGEVWLGDFLFAEKPFSLASFYDCVSQTSPALRSEYLRTKEQIDDLKGEDFSDVYYNRYMVERNLKKVKKLKKKLNSLEKQLELSKFNEKFFFITNLLETTRFSMKTDFKLTKSTKLALLTYAQVFIDSSEKDQDDCKRDTKIWMAFEMSRISEQLVFFIEMLRSRHRLVLKAGKKVSKFSNVYHNAVGLADLAVFYQFKCFDSLADTALDLIDALQLEDSMKVYLLQLATVSWVFSYSKQVKLPESLTSFKIDSQQVTKTTGKLRFTLFDKLAYFFNYFATAPIYDEIKEKVIREISDCLLVVLGHIQKDGQVLDTIKKMQKQSSFVIAKSLVMGHKFFKLVEEYPNFKTNVVGINFAVLHKEYPDEELERAWVLENQSVAGHQKLANLLKGVKKRQKIQSKSLSAKILKVLTGYSCNQNCVGLLEILNKYLADLYHCLYRVALFKSLDLHFLLEQIFSTSNSILSVNSCEVTIDQVKESIGALEVWKIHVKPASEKMKEKLRKKWNVRWRAKKRV